MTQSIITRIAAPLRNWQDGRGETMSMTKEFREFAQEKEDGMHEVEIIQSFASKRKRKR